MSIANMTPEQRAAALEKLELQKLKSQQNGKLTRTYCKTRSMMRLTGANWRANSTFGCLAIQPQGKSFELLEGQ